MRNPFRLEKEGMFSNKIIAALWFPVLIEQSMIVAIVIADTSMVAFVGEKAVAGISLITSIDQFVKSMFSGFAIGGSVVISQYVGKKDFTDANKSTKNLLYLLVMLGAFVSAIFFLFNNQFISWLATDKAELVVVGYAKTYFLMSLFSYPFFAAYYVSTATYRAMGNTKTPMICSLAMMVINLGLKALFIFVFDMGVLGAGLSTLISAVFIGIAMVALLTHKDSKIHIEKLFYPDLKADLIKTITNVGLPNGIESGMFQFGILLIQRLNSSLGTSALAANAVAKAFAPIAYVNCQCFGFVLVTIVGQCMGAGKIDQVKMYTKHIMKLNYTLSGIINIICIALSGVFVSFYKNLSPETIDMALSVMRLYYAMVALFYPLAFVLPYTLRGAGDTKYPMIVSFASMFGIRIGLAYLFVLVFNLGLFGIWLAMVLEWVIKGGIFLSRYFNGKWQNIKVI